MNQNRDDQPSEGERQPYEKPQVVSEEVFETLALSCAKTTGALCPDGPERS